MGVDHANVDMPATDVPTLILIEVVAQLGVRRF